MLAYTFRSLRYPHYRLYFFAQGVSLIGTWMQEIAVGWMVYRLTSSSLFLGGASLVSSIPVLLLAPFAGSLIDRFEKKNLIMFNQFLAFVFAFFIALTSYFQIFSVVLLYILLALMGVVMAIDMPARQAFLLELIETKEDLPNAIALNSSLVHMARLIGPGLGGILIYSYSESVCFLFNAFSFLVVFVALFFITPKPFLRDEKKVQFLHHFKEGLHYSWQHLVIRNTLLFVIAVTILGMVHPVLLPVFVKDVLHGDSKLLGLLMSFAGLGSLLGALSLAGSKNISTLSIRASFVMMIFSFALVGMGFATNLFVVLILLFISGASLTFALSSSNSIIQLNAETKMRGRVMGIYTQCFKGMRPFGSALSGSLSHFFGAQLAFVFSGGLSFFSAYLFWKSRKAKEGGRPDV